MARRAGQHTLFSFLFLLVSPLFSPASLSTSPLLVVHAREIRREQDLALAKDRWKRQHHQSSFQSTLQSPPESPDTGVSLDDWDLSPPWSFAARPTRRHDVSLLPSPTYTDLPSRSTSAFSSRATSIPFYVDLTEPVFRRDLQKRAICPIVTQTTVYVYPTAGTTVTLSVTSGPRPTGIPGDENNSIDGIPTGTGGSPSEPTSTDNDGGNSTNTALLVGIFVLIALLLIAFALLAWYYFRQRKARQQLGAGGNGPDEKKDAPTVVKEMGNKGFHQLDPAKASSPSRSVFQPGAMIDRAMGVWERSRNKRTSVASRASDDSELQMRDKKSGRWSQPPTKDMKRDSGYGTENTPFAPRELGKTLPLDTAPASPPSLINFQFSRRSGDVPVRDFTPSPEPSIRAPAAAASGGNQFVLYETGPSVLYETGPRPASSATTATESSDAPRSAPPTQPLPPVPTDPSSTRNSRLLIRSPFASAENTGSSSPRRSRILANQQPTTETSIAPEDPFADPAHDVGVVDFPRSYPRILPEKAAISGASANLYQTPAPMPNLRSDQYKEEERARELESRRIVQMAMAWPAPPASEESYSVSSHFPHELLAEHESIAASLSSGSAHHPQNRPMSLASSEGPWGRASIAASSSDVHSALSYPYAGLIALHAPVVRPLSASSKAQSTKTYQTFNTFDNSVETDYGNPFDDQSQISSIYDEQSLRGRPRSSVSLLPQGAYDDTPESSPHNSMLVRSNSAKRMSVGKQEAAQRAAALVQLTAGVRRDRPTGAPPPLTYSTLPNVIASSNGDAEADNRGRRISTVQEGPELDSKRRSRSRASYYGRQSNEHARSQSRPRLPDQEPPTPTQSTTRKEPLLLRRPSNPNLTLSTGSQPQPSTTRSSSTAGKRYSIRPQ